MSSLRDALTRLLWRLLIAAPIVVAGWLILGRSRGGMTEAGPVIIGVALLIAAGIVIGPAIAQLLAEPWGSLFGPNEYYSKPLPMYSIPESKRKKGLYEEALAGYREIAAKYPKEVRPYIEMIDVAIVELNDIKRAHAFYEQGLQAMRRREDRDMLTRMYAAISTRVKPKEPDAPRVIPYGRRESTPSPEDGD
jgi:hypothetical protein